MARQTNEGRLWASAYWYGREYLCFAGNTATYEGCLEYVERKAGTEVMERLFSTRGYHWFVNSSSQTRLDLEV